MAEIPPRLLFFVHGPVPTKAQKDDIAKQRNRGFKVEVRNAIYAKVEGELEPCDAVAGDATPAVYQDAYPWADDYDPADTPEVGEEFIGEDGHAYVRAVRGDGVAHNMRLSLAAPAAMGSGAPTHGPFAGFDHGSRIRSAEAERRAAGEREEGGGEGQGAGEGQQEPPPPVKPRAVKRKPAAKWNRNA